jgi:hypothetical protein
MTRRRWAARNRDRIDVHEGDEVEYWSKKWDVSRIGAARPCRERACW